MKRTLALTIGVVLALSLAACSSDNSDSNPSPVTSESATTAGVVPDRDALIAELRADGEANGAPTEQIDCVVDAIASLDAAQLQSIKDGTQDEDVSAVMQAASKKCIPSDSASPAPSQ